jgi:type IV pilus assembly protein PilY1
MHQLASRSYNHTFYVDGPTIEADACFSGGDTCTSWTNLLLGTGGAGGKTVFALDVTTPTSMTAASVKWEITPATTGYANLGNILTDVQTGLTVGGQWVAIFGNGYTGADGKAHLYVANLDTGTLIADITAGTATNNGLGGVRLVRDTKKRIIGAYAGDLKGSLWKFDLSNTSPSSWTTGMPQELYKTSLTPVQPITAPPTVVKHPTSGAVVAFGTGKFFESTDLTNSDVQALYGVWDKVAFGAASPTVVTQVDKTNLVQQTISAAITGTYIVTAADLSTSTAALNYYAVSRNSIDWASKNGWYINLTNTGQRTIYPLETLVGTIAAVDTISPSNVSLDPCVTTGTGKAWNYVIDMSTGGGPSAAIFDTNSSGSITSTDLLVSGYENAADGRTRYIKNVAKSTDTSTYFTPLSTQQQPGFGISCVVAGNCPSAIGTVKRSWRQLFLR